MSALAVGAAWATTMEAMGLEQLVERSPVAVMGEVTESRVQQTADGPYVLTTLRVDEALWGTTAQSVTVAVPGGAPGAGKFRTSEVTPGAPILLLGTNVVAFLQPDAAHGAMSIVGFSQGLIQVVKEGQTTSVTLPGEAKAMRWSAASSKLRELRASHRAQSRTRISR
ncbi:MAG TPA: hypothetical protein VFO36_02245 [Nitrospiraceae bacterium]|nr:hypothetical protein [Nitrospiraceae bacterium]